MLHKIYPSRARRGVLLCLAPLMISLGGCATLQTVGGVATQPTPIVNPVISAKAWYYVETLCNIPEQAYKTLNQAHQLPQGVHDTVRPILVKMIRLRKAAETAKKLGQATTFWDRVADLKATYLQIKGLFPDGAIPALPAQPQ